MSISRAIMISSPPRSNHIRFMMLLSATVLPRIEGVVLKRKAAMASAPSERMTLRRASYCPLRLIG